jgi:hypothetical protein
MSCVSHMRRPYEAEVQNRRGMREDAFRRCPLREPRRGHVPNRTWPSRHDSTIRAATAQKLNALQRLPRDRPGLDTSADPACTEEGGTPAGQGCCGRARGVEGRETGERRAEKEQWGREAERELEAEEGGRRAPCKYAQMNGSRGYFCCGSCCVPSCSLCIAYTLGSHTL